MLLIVVYKRYFDNWPFTRYLQIAFRWTNIPSSLLNSHFGGCYFYFCFGDRCLQFMCLIFDWKGLGLCQNLVLLGSSAPSYISGNLRTIFDSNYRCCPMDWKIGFICPWNFVIIFASYSISTVHACWRTNYLGDELIVDLSETRMNSQGRNHYNNYFGLLLEF